MAGPFSFGQDEPQPGVTPPTNSWINNIFGPPIAEQARMAGEAQDYRKNSAFQQASQQIASLAAEGKHPSEIAKALLMDPKSSVLKDLDADQMKSLFADIIPGVAPKSTIRPAGNSLFREDEVGNLSLGAEGGHTETTRNPATGDSMQEYRPGMTFDVDGKPSTAYTYPTASGQDGKDPNNAWWVANHSAPPELQMLFAAVGQKYGLPPDMLASQSYQESKWNPVARSPKGAAGISQFMPDTAEELGVDVNSVPSSIDGQGKYMKQLLDKFGGNYRHALMAYNWGQGNVSKWVARGADPAEVPDETVKYVRNITGDESSLPQINYRPGMSFTKALQAYLPEKTKATMADVDKVAMANPSLMFLGAGAVPMLSEIGLEIGRQISPEVQSEWGTANNFARTKLRRLTSDVAAYAVTSGGQRYKGPFDKIMQMDPSSGGAINDPQDAMTQAVELHDMMSDRVEELDNYNIDNTPKTLLDDYIKEKRLAQRILDDLPSRDQMTDMQGYMKKYPEVLPSGGSFITKALDFVNQGTGSVKQQVRQATGDTAPSEGGAGIKAPVHISSEEEWAALPAGAKFIDPQGRPGTKGQGGR